MLCIARAGFTYRFAEAKRGTDRGLGADAFRTVNVRPSRRAGEINFPADDGGAQRREERPDGDDGNCEVLQW